MRAFSAAFPVLAGLLLAATVWAATARFGVVVTPDSASYVGAARSLVRDSTVRVPFAAWDSPTPDAPLARFPPGLPAVLAAAGVFGVAPEAAARFANAASIFVLALLLFALLPRTLPARLLGLAALAGPGVHTSHLALWSEPLFMILALLILTAWRRLPADRWWPAAVLGLLAAASALTRYAGLFWAPALVVLLALQTGAPRNRWMRLGVWAGAMALPAGAWFAWLGTQGEAARRLSSGGNLSNHVRELVSTATAWLLPLPVPAWAGALLLALIVAAALLRVRAAHLDPSAALLGRAALVTSLAYLASVEVAALWADRQIKLDHRTVGPLALFAAIAAAWLWPNPAAGWRRHVTLAVPILVLVSGALVSYRAARRSAEWGTTISREHTYSSNLWRRSPTLAWLHTQPDDLAIFSNTPDAIAYHTGRKARFTPERSRMPTPAEFRRHLQAAAPAVLVVFRDEWRPRLTPRLELLRALGPLPPTHAFADADVFTFATPATPPRPETDAAPAPGSATPPPTR